MAGWQWAVCVAWVGALLGACVACGGTSPQPIVAPASSAARSTLPGFESEQELAEYLRATRARERERIRAGLDAQPPDVYEIGEEGRCEWPDFSLDWNRAQQHAEVDHGGQLRVHDRHLLALHGGWLYSMDLASESLRQTAAVKVARERAPADAVSYQTIFAEDRYVAVLGTRTIGKIGCAGRTLVEVVQFEQTASGRLVPRGVSQLRLGHVIGADLVDGHLLLYGYAGLPLQGGVFRTFPDARSSTVGSGWTDFYRLWSVDHVYRTPHRPTQLRIHGLTRCDLGEAPLKCTTTLMLGPLGSGYYVSPDAAYVWVFDSERTVDRQRPTSHFACRLPLDGSPPTGLGVAGSPDGSEACLQSDDGHLNALVGGWRPPGLSRGRRLARALLRVPLSAFSGGSGNAPEHSYREVPAISSHALRSRFVGHHVLYGSPLTTADADYGAAEALHVYDYVQGGPVVTIALPHTVERIEPVGDGVLVAGDDGERLQFSAVALTPEPRLVGSWPWPGPSCIAKGARAVSYLQQTIHSGIVGMIVGYRWSPYPRLRDYSPVALFLRNQALQLEPMSWLDARPEADTGRGSAVDCRRASPGHQVLFEGGRIFVRFGPEIVEGEVVDGRVEERARLTLFAPVTRKSH